MKKLIILSIAFILFNLSACTDLDKFPKNDLLENVVFTDEIAYTSYLAKLYASFTLTGQQGPAGQGDLSIIPDEGFSSYLRAYWKAQELTTDAAVIRWTDAGIQDLNTHTWSSENQFIRVMYYRIYYTVALCNDFLRVSTKDQLNTNNIEPDFQKEVEGYRLEARFLRALAYWHAIDLFRNVALITTIGTDLPSQVPPQELYNFLIGELDACVQGLPSPGVVEYGRASSAAARMLRAKVKLNAPNYLTSAPANLYNDVVEDMNAVIMGSFSLEPNYLDLFKADNDQSNEIIWAMSQDGVRSQSWGATTFMVRAMIFENFMEATDYGVISGWSGIRTTPEFVDLFESAPGVLDTSDKRNVLFTTGRIESTQADILGDSMGYLMPKYSNVSSTGADGSNSDWVDTDYPYFRLGDAYLMYAEAVLRGASNGDRGTAVGYINQLRQRAYGDNSGDITDADLTLRFLLDERGRELYYEATRRVDLIRFGAFSSKGGNEKIWEWKGGNAAGKSIAPYLEIFPIPASDLGVNGNLRQNPGY